MDNNTLFNEWLDRYGPLINKVCYFYATDVEDFKDLRQEGLLNLWRSIAKYRGECSPGTWTYRVILNSCTSYTRKNKRGVCESIDKHPELICDDGDGYSDSIAEMYSLIGRLDKVEKALILLWLDGYDYDSIASIVGMNKTTVGTRIFRIKAKLSNHSKE